MTTTQITNRTHRITSDDDQLLAIIYCNRNTGSSEVFSLLSIYDACGIRVTGRAFPY